MPTKALGYTKQLLMASFENNLTQQLAMEAEVQAKSANTEDYNEGVKSFLETGATVSFTGTGASNTENIFSQATIPRCSVVEV